MPQTPPNPNTRGSRAVSRLGYALLGLIRAQPRSGYALRMVFETTPMAVYSSSPGSIYPALKSLVSSGLVEQTADGRGKQVYSLTGEGVQALRNWSRQPVTETEVGEDLDLLLLRFAFLQDEPDRGLADAFLAAFEEAARRRASSLQAFLSSKSGAAMSLHSRLAVEHGIRSVLASADWAAHARRQLSTNYPHEEERRK